MPFHRVSSENGHLSSYLATLFIFSRPSFLPSTGTCIENGRVLVGTLQIVNDFQDLPQNSRFEWFRSLMLFNHFSLLSSEFTCLDNRSSEFDTFWPSCLAAFCAFRTRIVRTFHCLRMILLLQPNTHAHTSCCNYHLCIIVFSLSHILCTCMYGEKKTFPSFGRCTAGRVSQGLNLSRGGVSGWETCISRLDDTLVVFDVSLLIAINTSGVDLVDLGSRSGLV